MEVPCRHPVAKDKPPAYTPLTLLWSPSGMAQPSIQDRKRRKNFFTEHIDEWISPATDGLKTGSGKRMEKEALKNTVTSFRQGPGELAECRLLCSYQEHLGRALLQPNHGWQLRAFSKVSPQQPASPIFLRFEEVRKDGTPKPGFSHVHFPNRATVLLTLSCPVYYIVLSDPLFLL